MSHKPQDTPFGAIKPISFIIQGYPEENIKRGLAKIGDHFACYRKVEGRGDCFYRCLYLKHLASSPFKSFEQLFPSYQNEFRHIGLMSDVRQKLGQKWNSSFSKIFSEVGHKREELIVSFAKESNNDELLIRYYRERVYSYASIKYNDPEFASFVTNKRQILRILTMGRQAEGTDIFFAADALKVRIAIYVAFATTSSPQEIKPILYGKPQTEYLFELMLRAEHYEILYKQSPISESHTTFQHLHSKFGKFSETPLPLSKQATNLTDRSQQLKKEELAMTRIDSARSKSFLESRRKPISSLQSEFSGFVKSPNQFGFCKQLVFWSIMVALAWLTICGFQM